MRATEGLVLEEVVAGYGPRPVLRGLSLHVAPGEVVGLIGPNGSGKTTAVRVASRVLRPRSGRVLAGGADVWAIGSREAARRVAVVPQDLSSAFPFTVLEVILMGRAPHRERGSDAADLRRARDVAGTVRVSHLVDRPLERLSGGERQRVVLAQALAQDAPVLLLDEPTTHLDVRHVVEILDEVRSLSRSGTAVLAVFHDLSLAAAYCDRLVALDAGTIAAEGAPADVVTEGLLREVYGVEAEVVPNRATGRPSVVLAPQGPAEGGIDGLPRAHVVGGAGRGAVAIRALAEAGYEVTVGVLHASDTDAEVAERLNLRRVVVPPFSEVGEAARAEAVELMRAARVVVVVDAPYGPGNLGNLLAVEEAARAGAAVVVVEEAPLQDFTGGEAARLWGSIRARATVVPAVARLREALERY